jgi:hypothetical protein
MINWPQLPEGVADVEFREIGDTNIPEPKSRHPNQVYSPVGGRVSDGTVDLLINELTELADRFGYPSDVSDSLRISFDRAAAQVLRSRLDISWAEAGNRRLWSFLALVPLPHLTYWRFGIGNRERWIASDLTRHTWARLWWQAIVFDGHSDLLERLSESDLNQLLERRIIGGDPRLTRALANAVLTNPGGSRRMLIRDATKRLRRLLAFVDARALSDGQVADFCQLVVSQSVEAIDHGR